MDSKHHAVLSAFLALLLIVSTSPPVNSVLLAAAVLILGVGIDFDHFVVARIRTGSWRNLRTVLRNPRIAIFEQTTIFTPDEIRSTDRLLTHSIELVLCVGILWIANLEYWAMVAGATIGLHILADVYSDLSDARDPEPVDGRSV